jgi:primosomal protein N' (replication factor Y)
MSATDPSIGDESAPLVASVLLPLPLPEAFDYATTADMGLNVGSLVDVPLGRLVARGVVVALRSGAGVNRPLKPILRRLDDPTLPAGTLEFVHWAARYAVDAPGLPLAMTLRGLRAPAPKPERRLVAASEPPGALSPLRARVIAAAREPIARADLVRAAKVSDGVVKALIQAGLLRVVEVISETPEPARSPPVVPVLGPSQAAAVEALTGLFAEGFSVALLDGVTGSGKTEVYLETAAAALDADDGAQVLILLPEIALTPAILDRVARRFGVAPDAWHSGMTPARRRSVWERVATGRARIVVGARSALFLPFRRLSLVVVDEEHDGSYKQEDGFIYQARDLAVARAKIESCPVVLVSATPSLETLWNARNGRYRWLRLSDRHGEAELPSITLLDMRADPPAPGHWLSPPLVEAVRQTLARGEQSLLFLNRRGYAPLVLCKACGERMRAPDSDSWLVEHRYSGRLVCHLTGFSMPKPEHCPYCGAKDSLIAIGPGVERVEEEARRLFPDARIAVFSSDTTMDPGAAKAMVDRMTAGEFDILVATQAAAKGHDFPNLTLVGVVDADLGLRGGDLRAAERTFQLLTQVAGRAGRRERPGHALVQTYAPDHQVLAAIAATDREAFVEAELEAREAAGLPPFTRLAALIVSGPDAGVLEAFTAAMAQAAPNAEGVTVFGPADAPLGLIRGRRRKRFLVRAERSVDLQGYLAAWRARVRPPGPVRITIDVDPYSFL